MIGVSVRIACNSSPNYERCDRVVVQEDGGMFFFNIREAYIMPEQVCIATTHTCLATI
jgi:hypothetical protein